MRPATALALAAVLVAGPALARNRGGIPAAIPDGNAVSCIPIYQIDQSLVRSDRIIDFRMKGGRVYRNTLPQDCPTLGFEQRFGYTTSLSELCSSDIITVLTATPPMPSGSCGLGQFQPVKLAGR